MQGYIILHAAFPLPLVLLGGFGCWIPRGCCCDLSPSLLPRSWLRDLDAASAAPMARNRRRFSPPFDEQSNHWPRAPPGLHGIAPSSIPCTPQPELKRRYFHADLITTASIPLLLIRNQLNSTLAKDVRFIATLLPIISHASNLLHQLSTLTFTLGDALFSCFQYTRLPKGQRSRHA
jgi:hypothetical protein